MLNPSSIALIMLSAGLGSRMRGESKMKKVWEGKPLLDHSLEAGLSFPFRERLLVAKDLTLYEGYRTIVNPEPQRGMHSSIRLAIACLDQPVLGAVLCLGDQPIELRERLEALMKEGASELIRSYVGDEPGHPVYIGRNYFAEILNEADDDRGCHYLFKRHSFQRVEQTARSFFDFDTPEDFVNWPREV